MRTPASSTPASTFVLAPTVACSAFTAFCALSIETFAWVSSVCAVACAVTASVRAVVSWVTSVCAVEMREVVLLISACASVTVAFASTITCEDWLIGVTARSTLAIDVIAVCTALTSEVARVTDDDTFETADCASETCACAWVISVSAPAVASIAC